MAYFKSKYTGDQIEQFLDNAIKATEEAISATLDLDKIKRVILMLVDAGKKLNSANIASELEREETYNKLLLANQDLFDRIDEALENITAGVDTVDTDAIKDGAVTNRKIADRTIEKQKLSAELQELVENFVKVYTYYIPSTTSAENPLVTQKDLDNVKQGMGRYLAKNADGDAFATKAELTSSSATFYYGTSPTTPKTYDYVTVLADEDHENASTCYARSSGVWVFRYKINNEPFTEVQMAAINSGIQRGESSTGYVEGATAKQIVDNKKDLIKIKDSTLNATPSEDNVKIQIQTGGDEGEKVFDLSATIAPATDTSCGVLTPTQKGILDGIVQPELSVEAEEDNITIKYDAPSVASMEPASVEIPCVTDEKAGIMKSDTYKEHEDLKTAELSSISDENNVFINLKTTEETINANLTVSEATSDNAGVMSAQRIKEIEDLKAIELSSEIRPDGITVKVHAPNGTFIDKNLNIDNASDAMNGMMSNIDKVSLDNLKTINVETSQTDTDAKVKVHTLNDQIASQGVIGPANNSQAGLMTAADKIKFDKALIKDEGGIVSKPVEFTDKVTVITPTEDMEAATKKYVDENGGKVQDIKITAGTPSVGVKEPENKRIDITIATRTSHLINDGTGNVANPYTLKDYVDSHDGVTGIESTPTENKVTLKVTTPSAETTTKEAQVDVEAATADNAGVMTAQHVKDLNGKQVDIKVKVVDMEAAGFSPVLNTYYQHSYDSATANTYMKGMIYRYKNVTTEKLDPFGQSYDPKQYETVPTFLPIDGSGSGGSGGVSSYNELTNKPQINSVELAGNVTPASLGIPYTDLKADSIPMINGVKVMGQKKADGSNIDGEYYGLTDKNEFDDLKQIVEGLGGALVYIGDYISDASETDLKGGMLSNFVFQETGGASQNGYLVKVHATTGGFRGEYLYVSGSGIATWKLYSESESVTPATYTTKGVVQIKENAGLKLTDGVLEAEVTADNDKTFTHKYLSGSTEAGNVLRNFGTDIFKDGVKVSVLDDTCTHDQIATAKATYDAFVASGAGDVSRKLDKVEYTETESGNNTGVYAHSAEQQKTIPIVTAFPDDVNNSQIASAKLVKDKLDTKLDKISVATKGLYFHDGTTQGEKLVVGTIGPTSTDDEIPTAKAAYSNQAGKLDARTNSASEVYTHEGDVQGGKTIVKTIDSNSTDEQIPTAKAAYSNQADKLTKNETTTPNQAITAANIGAATKLTNNDYVYANYGTTQKNLEMCAIIKTVLMTIYPVGAYYISNSSTNPKDILGFGTWTAVVGALYGAGTTNSNQTIAGKSGTSSSITYSVGNVKESLPNVKGTVGRDCDWGSGSQDGAFYRSSSWGAKNCDGSNTRPLVYMDLNRDNSIYQDSAHVKVGGYCAYVWRRTN